nr:YpjP family protein [uncultured Bacillus sp.]
MTAWLRKSLVILVTIATFGMVTPHTLSNNSDEDSSQEKRNLLEALPTQTEKSSISSEIVSERNSIINEMIKHAEHQSYMKFGPKIKPIIEDEFREVILPNIEKAINHTALQYPEEDLSQLVLSEMPGGGTSEKIFHIKNQKTNTDVIRFHVRRDHPPQEGYIFNFHYHTEHDQFQTHYELGVIYWDKNTPPKWMS